MKFLVNEDYAEIEGNNHCNDFQLFLRSTSRISERRKGVSVVWRDLNVIAEIKKHRIFRAAEKTRKHVIHNVTGAIYPGNLVAIMGASGAGKTTLMSVLSNRLPSGIRYEGDIRINNQPIEKFDKRGSGYVYQDDLFFSCLTVLEHLNFAAKLRLDKKIDKKDRQRLIFQVLQDIGLLKVANTRIGNSKSGKETTSLSGGERKRLSVATELLTEPMLLFCDEPTTGLDSYTATKTISMLQNLAVNQNKTIICSIHQPNQQTFQLFKQIILLSQGRIVFNGSPDEAKVFFLSQGYYYDNDQNLAEYFIKSIASRGDKLLHTDFSNSEYSQKIKKYVDNAMNQRHSEQFEYKNNYRIQTPNLLEKFITVSHRNILEMHRNSYARNVRITQKLFINFFLGLCLYGSVTKTQPGLRAFQAVVYVSYTQNFFPAFFLSFTQIIEDLPLFYREYSNSSVTPSIFYLSKVITNLPLGIVEPLINVLIMYYMAGLDTSQYTVIMTSIVNILLSNATAAFGILFSLVFSNFMVAQSYANPVLNVLLFTCGLFIKLSSLPFIISWIKYVSWFSYACSAIYIIHWNDVYDIECESNSNVPCLQTGREVVKFYDFDKHTVFSDLTTMALIYLTFHVAAYLRLLYKIKQRTI